MRKGVGSEGRNSGREGGRGGGGGRSEDALSVDCASFEASAPARHVQISAIAGERHRGGSDFTF